ncbi:MAG: hypothetical protein JXB15_00655 [Anaerolineales bacterium]|nr:hypothetical protein [Anaerolineales bacterium]
MNPRPQRGNLNTEEYRLVEARLRAALTPVAPRGDYVSGVRTRLTSLPVKKRSKVDRPTLALAALGLFGSLLAIIASIRAVLAVIGVVELIRHMRGQSRTKRTAAA